MKTPLKILRWIWLALTVMLALATVTGANAGLISPLTWTFPSFLAMAFPILLIATILATVINLVFIRRWALIQLVSVLLSVNALASFCPINYPKSAPEGSEILKVMSYNVYNLNDTENLYPDGNSRTLTQIIHSGADIVVLQEFYDMSIYGQYASQIDSVKRIYPYSMFYGDPSCAFLSKYPLSKIGLGQPGEAWAGWLAAETVVNGDTILLISAHLQSLGLSNTDKINYQMFTEGDRVAGWKGKAMTLYEKLDTAFVHRAIQADRLACQIDSLGYKNVILSGDFNDVEACYALRRLRRGRMYSAFAKAGCGPIITYNSDRFYFHIDHILYEGNLRALDFRCGDIRSSDHYPVYCTFEMLKR